MIPVRTRENQNVKDVMSVPGQTESYRLPIRQQAWKEEMTMSSIEENAAKKEYLSEYRHHVHRISRIESELEEIRIMRSNPSAINNDGMPHGSGQSDLSDYAAALDDMERELREERYRRIMAYKDIARRIKNLQSEKEKDVMFYRYIKGMAWHEIAERMGMSERNITRLHGRALANIKINLQKSENVLECPGEM